MEAGAAVTAITSRSILANIASLLFPLRCVHCGREGDSLCSQCIALLELLDGPACSRCGSPDASSRTVCHECAGRELRFRSARAAFAYRGPARSIVHAIKYRNQRRLARKMAALSCGSRDLTGMFRGAVLVPVPMHSSRQYERGYNQAALYAGALAKQLDLSCRELLLKRNPTEAQNRLDAQERKRNLAGSFSMRRKAAINAGRVMLIDDVYTTGSTASECARVLEKGLGVEVDVWTFARTVKRWSKDVHFPMGDKGSINSGEGMI